MSTKCRGGGQDVSTQCRRSHEVGTAVGLPVGFALGAVVGAPVGLQDGTRPRDQLKCAGDSPGTPSDSA